MLLKPTNRSTPTRQTRFLSLLMIAVLALCAGCIPPAGETPAPPAPSSYPAPSETVEIYPAPDATAAGETGIGSGLGGAPAVDNRSRITARLVASAPDESLPDTTRLRVEVLASEPLNGLQDFTAGRVGEQIDLLAASQGMPALEPGDTLRAEVRYAGDERGGAFFAQQIELVVP